MMLLIALSVAGAPIVESPARRFDAVASAGFTASVTIRRGAAVGHDKKPPKGGQDGRLATVEDAAGQPHPALIYDFE